MTRPGRAAALVLIVIAGALAALAVVGLVSAMVTGLILLSQFVLDLTHGI
jgi:hypothetical protein